MNNNEDEDDGKKVDQEDDGEEGEGEGELKTSQTLPLLALFLAYVLAGSLLIAFYEPEMTFFKGSIAISYLYFFRDF
jgi:hypothetical protein